MSLPFRPHAAWPASLVGDWNGIDRATVNGALTAVHATSPRLSQTFIERVCLPLSGWVAARARSERRVIALGGPPGSGKSTLARVLELLLSRLHGLDAAGFSLDDVYYTKARRQELARDVHPLFATRGVPGTHDVELAHQLIDDLDVAGPKRVVRLPRFDKLADDRMPQDRWQHVAFLPRVVLVDAWFWGAAPATDASLVTPVNAREAAQDPDGAWRRHVRDQLAGPYAELFDRAHHFIRIDAPSWETTLDWRVQQQVDLLGLEGPASEEDRSRLTYFLELFERVALLPSRAEPDFVLGLDAEHELATLSGSALRRWEGT